jgi:hypothetical protein
MARDDRLLTALLGLQCFIIAIGAPWAATGYPGGRVLLELSGLAFAVLVFQIAHGPVTKAISVLAISSGIAGSVFGLWFPSHVSPLLGSSSTLIAFVLVIYLVGRAVLAPGDITVHRVLGAVALYLSFGMAFATTYRLGWQLAPASLANIPADIASWQLQSPMLYFSFATLTSVGYGDILPVQPFVRALSNLEAIIGQLYPATLLARLVTLELERRRR